MESAIARTLNLKTLPVAVIWTDERPEGALQFEKGKWGCVMAMFGAAAITGKSAVFDRETYGCFGGGSGLGFGNTYALFPGGEEGFCRFLSSGNGGWPPGETIAAGMAAGGARPEFVHHFLHGERYKKSPELVRGYLENLAQMDVPARYVAFTPLPAMTPGMPDPKVVSFVVTPDQLAALVVLASYDRAELENVAIPFVAGCQAVGLLSYREGESARPRGVVGQIDLSARKYLRGNAGRDVFTFSVPYARFLEMEKNVTGSFLEGETWRSLLD